MLCFRESPMKSETNANSIKIDAWAYKTKLIESTDLFARDHFPDIKRKKEITLALNACKEINVGHKIGARVAKQSLEYNQITNSLKFDNQVLRGFAITWHKQTVVHYVDFSKIGTYLINFYFYYCVVYLKCF